MFVAVPLFLPRDESAVILTGPELQLLFCHLVVVFVPFLLALSRPFRWRFRNQG